MATLRNTQGEPGRTPWGWIIGLVVVGVATFAIIWWMRAGAPPADTTGQQGVEERAAPAQQQPGAQPPVLTPGPGEQPGTQPGAQPGTPGATQPPPPQPGPPPP